MKKKKNLLLKIKKLLFLLNKIKTSHPYFVVIAMHEFFRSLYPYDPYIKNKIKDNFFRIEATVDNLISYIKFASKLGAYKNNLFIDNFNTQDLFGKLWSERFSENKLNSQNVLIGLLKRSGFNLNFFKNKKILDIGCGSGRFTIAFSKLKTKLSVGIDLGIEGIKYGRLVAKQNKIKNIKFYKANVLKIPFKSNSFDFVFCKGVLHHTGNTFAGLAELKRVLKPGGMGFLYLYGSGGIFWNTRKLMRKIMKSIPFEYTIKILKLIGMPASRTIFVDSWYVPVEDHINKETLERWFKKNNINFTKYSEAKKTELEYVQKKEKYFKEIYGSGELRYSIHKES